MVPIDKASYFLLLYIYSHNMYLEDKRLHFQTFTKVESPKENNVITKVL